ncbi:MAG: recombination mediator RecR [Candidatus Omnitrophica bacterium]|nr:recombination mediator RecR [Candidatus Omnitrophota bacterium]
MAGYPELVEGLIEQLNKFPGIGRRSAERIVYYILRSPTSELKKLVNAIIKAKEGIRLCRICNGFAAGEVCSICGDEKRDKGTICVVEEPKDVNAVERAGGYTGHYHVLLGSIAPLEGRGPEDLKVNELIQRIKQNGVKEIILATDSDTEGEATALYLARQIRPFGASITRIGIGLPMGSNLEYADSTTIARALSSRKPV